MEKRKVYIAGKITGTDYKECINKFAKASDMLTIMGYQPVNPMRFGIDKNATSDKALEICIPILLECDILFMLTDWRTSPGAIKEFQEWFKNKSNHQFTMIMEEEKGYAKLAQIAEMSSLCA